LAERFDYDPIEGFDPQLSVQENCWHSEGAGQADFGFFMDGRYHSIIALSRWPKMTYPGIIHRLTSLRLLDYTITVNLDPLSVRKEINKEEKEHDRIAGDYASEKKLSLLTVMDKKQKKIAALMQGHTIPFKVLFAIRTWDKSKEGLIAKTTAIKNAINSMNSAQYAESTLPSTSKKLFFQTWPGWTWSRYNSRKLYGENRYIADMLPIASTFTGHLDSAEAIYEGPNQNLVGIKTFSGSAGNQSPQHAVLIGMSGTGKSVTICDLLSQTENYYAYTVIIEEGLSYGIYTQTVEPDAKPIVIQPDGDITINYLDTKGLPLTPDHLASATALVARMVGLSQSEDILLRRHDPVRQQPQAFLQPKRFLQAFVVVPPGFLEGVLHDLAPGDAALQLAVGDGQFLRALPQFFLQPDQVDIVPPRGAMGFLNRGVGLGKKNPGKLCEPVFNFR
jgi:hypothetical protein